MKINIVFISLKHIKLKKRPVISKKQLDVSATCKFSKNLTCEVRLIIPFAFSFNKFQQQELWQEVERVTAALRTENEAADSEIQFLCEMFKHIPLGKTFIITDSVVFQSIPLVK